jgi:hypothetical protein
MATVFTACERGPSGIDAPLAASAQERTLVFGASVVAASKTAISGTISNSVPGIPARVLQTPSGRCHYFGWPNATQFTGDVSGAVTFEEHINAPCNLTDLVANGPISGTVTWNGRTGEIAGEWTTNCNPDASQPVGLSCDGVMNARGSGDLEGVHFKFNWGPGWFPFPYTGTASVD